MFPEVIAEISANHNGSLDRALDIVRAVAKAGADAIKLQTYTADTITLDSDLDAFIIPSDHPLWGGRKLFDLYTEAHTPWEWHEPIFELARSLGMDAFSSPFDETAVDFLESLGVSRYKVASLEIVDIPLIEKIAGTGKPMILSTGASTLDEVAEAVGAIRSIGDNPLTLLVCSSSYPAAAEDSNLLSMATLRDRFGTSVGFSDHTTGSGAAVAAAVLGASVIEKHVTLDSEADGPDDSFSAEPGDLETLISAVRDGVLALGVPDFGYSPAEELSRSLRPSLWLTQDVKTGDSVSLQNVASLRPSGGMPPSEIGSVLGKTFTTEFTCGSPLLPEMLRDNPTPQG
jgi:N-acetylneuraminate synthase